MSTRSLTIMQGSIDVGQCSERDGTRCILLTGEGVAPKVQVYAHLTPACARDLAKRLLSAADTVDGVVTTNGRYQKGHDMRDGMLDVLDEIRQAGRILAGKPQGAVLTEEGARAHAAAHLLLDAREELAEARRQWRKDLQAMEKRVQEARDLKECWCACGDRIEPGIEGARCVDCVSQLEGERDRLRKELARWREALSRALQKHDDDWMKYASDDHPTAYDGLRALAEALDFA